MFTNLAKLSLLVVAIALFAIMVGGVSTISADAPQAAPPTVVLPTPVKVRPTATPVKAAAPKGSGAPKGGFDTTFTTSITYQNIGSAATTSLQLSFYASPTDVSPTVFTLTNLNSLAASSLFVGSVSGLASPFNGSGVLSSDQPMAATLVQVPQGTTTVKNRPLSNGFSSGGSTSLLASVLKNTFDTNTKFSVQNADSVDNDFSAKFYDTSANLVTTLTQTGVKPGAVWSVDASTVGALGASFNGSVVVQATKTVGGAAGSAVTSALELGIGNDAAKAFQGLPSGATTVYMPSALCNFGDTLASTAYAVQNTSLTTATDVTVTYSNSIPDTKTIGAGSKASFLACNASGMPAGFLGSAKITSTGGINIIAIGKAINATGLATAFEGFSTGGQKVALPYVRWANDADYAAGTRQRVNIAIQNIDTVDVSNVTVKYYNSDGTQAGSTHTIASIAASAKANSNATLAGLTEFGFSPTPGGAVIVEGPSGAKLAVIARVQTQVSADGTIVAEDYDGITIQ